MKKIGVIFYSISGSTGEIAEILKNELSKAQRSVEIMDVSEVRDLDRFDTIIIGSPMRFGSPRSKIINLN